MSAVWSLSGAKQTWRGQPISVAFDPEQTLSAMQHQLEEELTFARASYRIQP
jgi:hypothetical protein